MKPTEKDCAKPAFSSAKATIFCGELATRLHLEPLEGELTQFCPRSLSCGGASRIEIHAVQACKVRVILGFDSSKLPAPLLRSDSATLEGQGIGDCWCLWETPCGQGQWGGAFLSSVGGAGSQPEFAAAFPACLGTHYRFRLWAGQTIEIQHPASLASSVMHHAPDRQALLTCIP